MSMVRQLYRWMNTILNTVTKILLIILTVLVFGMAVCRLFSITFPWSLDLPLLLFTWLAFLSMAQASREQAHNGVDVLVRVLPAKVQYVIGIINTILIIGFLSIITYHACLLTVTSGKRTITTLGISYNWLIWSCVLGCILMTFFECVNLIIKALHPEVTK